MAVALRIQRATGHMSKTVCLGKAAKSCGRYCGPLSLFKTSGMPYLVKVTFNAEIVLLDVVDGIFTNSGYLEK